MFPSTRRRLVLSSATVIVVAALACTDLATDPVRQLQLSHGGPPEKVVSFACGVSYTSITYNNDSEMAQFGVAPVTDTSRVCETWTGADYKARIDRIGSSVPTSDVSDAITTVVYSDGQATGYLADGSPVADAQGVGANAFEFGQATPAEQQASYNDPYYGVAQSVLPGGCPGNPQAIICNDPNVVGGSDAGALRSRGFDPTKSDHGNTRRSLRALLIDSDEITGAGGAASDVRRFRAVRGDEQTIVTVERGTELIRSQEILSPSAHTLSRLSWARQGNRYIRDRMEIDSEEMHDGKRFGSKVIVLIQDVRFDPSVLP